MSQAGIINVIENNPQIPTQFNADIGFAVPLGNILNIVGGTEIQTVGSGNTITINVTGSMVTWQIVTSADNPVTLTDKVGYIPKGGAPVNFILPAAASVGDTFRILGYGNLYTIAQNAGQRIKLGSAISTLGATGSVTATMISDSLELICVTANTEFYCDIIQGNPTVA